MKNLIIILGDQLNSDSPVLQNLNTEHDCLWMAEVPHESEHVWSHKARSVLFLAAMRNFSRSLRQHGHWVIYHKLGEHEFSSLAQALVHDIRKYNPETVSVVQPGDYRVLASLRQACEISQVRFDVKADTHFLIDITEFTQWADGQTRLRMESFYRYVRKKTGILMEKDQPLGGRWNYDANNRKSFSKQGPGMLIMPKTIKPNNTTRRVRQEVEEAFPSHPGTSEHMNWPVTRTQALEALQEFIDNRLYSFGPFQDAMWSGQPFLFHSRLSTALNMKLLSPAEVVNATIEAWDKRQTPIASVEGFIRQVIGWREYMRGIYWMHMPDYIDNNVLGANLPLPDFYWTAETDMTCMRETIGQVLQYGYAHHIQRLMVTGLFALLLGVEPRKVHEWYLAMFVDAVEWVELPNTLGMSQYADGGLLASKPYVASGKYIQRMSNYCAGCRYNPANASGDDACPFTTLYWDFLMRHENRFAKHPRVALQWRNLSRIDRHKRQLIQQRAEHIRLECFDQHSEKSIP